MRFFALFFLNYKVCEFWYLAALFLQNKAIQTLNTQCVTWCRNPVRGSFFHLVSFIFLFPFDDFLARLYELMTPSSRYPHTNSFQNSFELFYDNLLRTTFPRLNAIRCQFFFSIFDFSHILTTGSVLHLRCPTECNPNPLLLLSFSSTNSLLRSLYIHLVARHLLY